MAPHPTAGPEYGALDRLGDEGLVANDREEIVDGRLRRYYRLTDDGLAALRAETERMRLNVAAASRRLRARDRATHPAARMRLPGHPLQHLPRRPGRRPARSARPPTRAPLPGVRARRMIDGGGVTLSWVWSVGAASLGSFHG
jgi:hypothetical protein